MVMSEPSGGGADAGEVSDEVIDWIDKVDKFALSWFLSSMLERVPHARLGAVEFSLGGVLWKTVLYGLAYVAGFAYGWYYLFDQDQDWVRTWIVCLLLLAFLAGFAVRNLLGRYEYGKERPGPWFVVLSFLFVPLIGVIFGAASATPGGVFRWVLVSVAVLAFVGVLVFPVVMRLVRNRFASWAVMVVLCVVPSWMLVKPTGSAGASLFWCCLVGVVGALWFVLDMLGIEKCASMHRDAAFEWLAAWALAFDLTLTIASIIGSSNSYMGVYKDDDDTGR